jgi:hypothetical protein
MMTRDELKLAIAKALALAEGAKWDAANFNETLNGESPSDMRGAYEGQAQTALAALEAAGVEITPKKPTSTMIRDGVSHRLCTKITGENTWPEDTAALYTTMLAANPYRSAP